MPLVNIEVIKGVFSAEQKSALIERVTDAMVSVEGEALRGLTWVRIQEFEEGDWAIGGKPLSVTSVNLVEFAIALRWPRIMRLRWKSVVELRRAVSV